MADFTAAFTIGHQAELDAAYRRGAQEKNAEIARLNTKIGELIKERQAALNAMVSCIYDEEKREAIRISLEKAYGLIDTPTEIGFLNPLTSDDYAE